MNKNRRSIVRPRFTILCNGDTEVQRNEGNSWIYQALWSYLFDIVIIFLKNQEINV